MNAKQRLIAAAWLLFVVTLLGACGSSDYGAAAPPVTRSVTTTTDPRPPSERFGAAAYCKTWRQAATAASAAYFASTGAYAATFTELTAGTPPVLELTDVVEASETALTGPGWTLTMSGGGRDATELECSDGPPESATPAAEECYRILSEGRTIDDCQGDRSDG